jgi:poly-gamma-glutamate capsule biosynthesis protein CapA/YwtB (metallophosphatase superfamily)
MHYQEKIMRPVSVSSILSILMLLFIGSSLLLSGTLHHTSAAPAHQNHPLDAPLTSMNQCGSGDMGNVHFTFATTGDTFPHENIQAVGEAQGYDALFDDIRPFLQAADAGYTNFDGAMLEGSPYTGYPTFNYNPQLATALKNAGIDVVSTANNHILDRGPAGIDATLNVLKEADIQQHGVISSSVSATLRPPYLPITLSRDGASITIGFLSFTWGTNGIPDPYNQVNLLWQSNAYEAQGGIRQEVLDAIALAKQETDIVVVAAHWGYEYHFYPDQSQIDGAQKMAAAGADVILGAQPHTLQPVDVIDTDGRKTLVIYSLANFIASQGAYQATSFTNTSVIFYVGFIRHADGSVSLSGYRYLPMTMTADDTRPVPFAAQGQEQYVNHVRQKMRDPYGLRQVSPDPPAPDTRVEVCPPYTFVDEAGQPVQGIPGDFAQYVATLGSGRAPRPMDELRTVFGYPLGPVQHELSGDCQHSTAVLYTERQRLEWHPANDWPSRVQGTQLGTAVYQQRYPDRPVQRRVNLDSEAFANEVFRTFYDNHGGMNIFGYPISGELIESNEQGSSVKPVQYFERARFELVSGEGAAAQPPVVQLGRPGYEFAGMNEWCGVSASPVPPAPLPTEIPALSEPSPVPPISATADIIVPPVQAATGSAGNWWHELLLIVLVIWFLAIIMGYVVQHYLPWLNQRLVKVDRASSRVSSQQGDDEELLHRLLDRT